MSSWGAFVGEWGTVRLGELGEIFDGPHATPKRVTEGPYFLNISSLVDGRLDLTKSDRISEEQFGKWTRRVTPSGGDLLFSYETRLGDAALMPAGIRACLGRRMALIRPDRTRVEPRFLLYLYLSPIVKRIIAQNTIHGATVNRIALSTMADWMLPFPPLSKQRAIAEVLGALDDKIAANARLADAADAFLAESLSGALRTRLYDERPLGEIAEINALAVRPTDGDLRYIDIASIGVGWYESPPATPWVDAPSRARRGVRYGDTLWSTVRPNRRSHALVLDRDARLVASTGLAVLTPRDVSFAYVYEVTRRPAFSRHLETVAEGSAYPAVRADRFASALVPVLEVDQLRKFARVAEPLRERVAAAQRESAHLVATRDALLPALMSGRLRVREAEDVVADAV